MSMNPPGSNEPPQPPGQGVPPGYSPPPGSTPPGSTPPGYSPPPDGGFSPPGSGGFTPPGSGGFSAPPAGGFQPIGGGFGAAPGPLAEWPQRALGGLIDYVGPWLVAVVILGLTRNFGIYLLFWLVSVGWGAYNGYLNGSTGQSIGKKVIGLKVVGEQTGQVIGGGQGVLRWGISAAMGLIPCLGWIVVLVNLLFPLWDAKKQTLHDKAVKSLVIVVPK